MQTMQIEGMQGVQKGKRTRNAKSKRRKRNEMKTNFALLRHVLVNITTPDGILNKKSIIAR